MMPPKEATAATEITEIAMIPAEEKEEGVFLFGESGLFDPLSPLDSLEELDSLDKMGLSDLLEMELLELVLSLEEELLEFVPSLELVSIGIRSYTAVNVTSSVTTNV